MGDSRFHLKASFEVYGEKFEWDASLNWCAEQGEIDERIKDWFVTSYENAYQKYQEAIYADDRVKREAESEAKEKAELQRLKAKYEKS